MPELWDIYDRDRRLTGTVIARGEPIPKGGFYLGVNAFTVSGDRILITRRSPEKESFAGMWEFSGGACQAGEDSLSGITRELSEEIGVRPEPEELTLLGTTVYPTSFDDNYLFLRELTLSELRLQPEEVSDARLVSPTELDRLCAEGIIVPSVAARWYRYRGRIAGYLQRTGFGR